jgi:hypothetical protein
MQFGSTFNNSAWRHELAAVCELRSRGGSLAASLLAHERQAAEELSQWKVPVTESKVSIADLL